MRRFYLFFLLLQLACLSASAQQSYTATMRRFQAAYVQLHEVVKGKDRQYFRFFPVSASYVVKASFERITDTIGFVLPTSSGKEKTFFVYGKISFQLRDTPLHLFLYQSKDLRYTSYKDHLFLPFTDLTTGDESYGSGRYIDIKITDISANNSLLVDFNKAYNPYCAYASGYNCPIPPKANDLPIAIRAGEKNFARPYH